jgi:cell division protein ZipA
MELGIKEILMLLGGLAVLGVICDGLYRAWRVKKDDIKMAIDPDAQAPGGNEDDWDWFKNELPSGGARKAGNAQADAPKERINKARLNTRVQSRPQAKKAPIKTTAKTVQQKPLSTTPSIQTKPVAALQKASMQAKKAVPNETSRLGVNPNKSAQPSASVSPKQPLSSLPEKAEDDLLFADHLGVGKTQSIKPEVSTQGQVKDKQEEKAAPKLAEKALKKEIIAEKPKENAQAQVKKETKQKPSADLLMIYLVSNQGKPIYGLDLLNALMRFGLRFGEMNIFHQVDQSDQTTKRYSVANMEEPGTFDLDKMNEINTSGLVLFLEPKKIDNPNDALDDMLEMAGKLSVLLDLELRTQKNQRLNETIVNEMRASVAQLAEA